MMTYADLNEQNLQDALDISGRECSNCGEITLEHICDYCLVDSEEHAN